MAFRTSQDFSSFQVVVYVRSKLVSRLRHRQVMHCVLSQVPVQSGDALVLVEKPERCTRAARRIVVLHTCAGVCFLRSSQLLYSFHLLCRRRSTLRASPKVVLGLEDLRENVAFLAIQRPTSPFCSTSVSLRFVTVLTQSSFVMSPGSHDTVFPQFILVCCFGSCAVEVEKEALELVPAGSRALSVGESE